jgi:hypothetical protein
MAAHRCSVQSIRQSMMSMPPNSLSVCGISRKNGSRTPRDQQSLYDIITVAVYNAIAQRDGSIVFIGSGQGLIAITDYLPSSAADNDLIDLSTLLHPQRYNDHLRNLIGLVSQMFKDTDIVTKTWRCDECHVTDCGHVIIDDPGTENRTHCCSEGGHHKRTR